jgi:hypothetical protein
MKIIFLDIDGVLNHQKWYEFRHKNVDIKLVASEYPKYEFDPNSVECLNWITDATGAKIVVSSTWRHGKTVEELQELLKSVGVTGEVIGKTPSFGSPKNYDGRGENPGYTIPRGCEIDYWLDRQDFQRINWSIEVQKEYAEKSKVSNYIILDDDSDMLYNQREHFFKTPQLTGLDTEIAKKAILFLNKPIWEVYYETDYEAFDKNLLK